MNLSNQEIANESNDDEDAERESFDKLGVDQDEEHEEQEENDGFKKPHVRKFKGCKSKKGMKPKQSLLKKNASKKKWN